MFMDWFFLKVGVVVDTTTEVNIFVLVHVPWFKVTGMWENKTFCASYLTLFEWIWMEFGML